MDGQQFLAEFGHIANAPGGVARLRELVLALAVQGRLVLQDGSDEPADKQLARIKKIAANTPSTGRRKKTIATVRQVDLSKPLPRGWTSTRLCDLLRVLNGRAYSRQELLESGTPVLRVGNLFTSDRWYYSNLELPNDKYCDAGDLLFAWSASFGPFIWRGKRVIYHYHIWKLDLFSVKDVDKRFLYTWLLEKTQEIKAAGHGISMAHMTKEKFERLEVGLPPLNEQARIVAKVDELMALCDRLEQQQQGRRKLQNALRQSTLLALASAESPHELQESWQRLQGNFGSLVFEPSDVDDVAAELKNLAVRGLLATASPGPVDMERIKSDSSALRAGYIASGLMRRQKLVGRAETDVSYPEHWELSAFDEVAVVIGGVTKGRNLRGKKTLVCPYLSVANVQRGYFKLTALKSIEIAENELTKYAVHEGDLLITEGGDWDKVGRTAIWRGGAQNCLHQNHVFKARVPSDHLLDEWVELAFNSDVGRDYFAGASKQTTNLASINMTQLRGFPLPVPPLDEQRRILKKLADLTAHCNAWRDQLDKKAKLSALLANVVVAGLTGIDFEQKEEAVNAPQIELIAPLRLGTLPDVKDQAPLATLLARRNGEMSAVALFQAWGSDKGIDAFYAQLKTEVAHGWITEPPAAEVRAKTAEAEKGLNMQLRHLSIPNFRNLRGLVIDFATHLEPRPGEGETATPKAIRSHALIGQNGTGKSNLIEALITIFRDVDLDRDAAFDYTLEYEIRGHVVRIEAKLAKQRRPFAWIDGDRVTQEYLNKNDPPDKTPRDERRGPRLLPSHVFAYYSGRNERIEALFQDHQRRFNRLQEITTDEVLPEQLLSNFKGTEADIRAIEEAKRRRETRMKRAGDDRLRRLFYCRGGHSQLVLLACLLSDDPVFQKVLKNLHIESLESALFVLKEPYRLREKRRNGKFDEVELNEGDPRFWFARGSVVSEFLDSLWQVAWAPIEQEVPHQIDFRGRTEKQRQLYLYVPNQAKLQELGRHVGGTDSFFRYAEGAYIGDLIEEVRITVKKRDEHGGKVSFTQLSEGELQMLTVLGLMRITREDHCLFLLDEPDTHLNPIWKLRYFDDIEGVLHQEGEALMQGASQVLITTHDPMMIGSLKREQVHILRREDDGTAVHTPYEHPQGMGVAGLLKSELFGLPSTLDPQTLDDLQRRNELIAKKADEGLTPDEESEIQRLRRYLEELGFSREYRDPMYQLFIEKMYKAKSQPISKLLTPVELADQEARAEAIIKELVKSERNDKLTELARQLKQAGG